MDMKGPFSCRNSTIFAAKLGPIPGRLSNSDAFAVLMFNLLEVLDMEDTAAPGVAELWSVDAR